MTDSLISPKSFNAYSQVCVHMSVSDTTAGTTYGTEETKATFDGAFDTDDEFDAGCPRTEFCVSVLPCY